jgi:AAA family ATPase
MSSKGKKKKKPSASPEPSPRTPSSRAREALGGFTLDLPSTAAAAAARYPALVPRGGAGCVAGTVYSVVPRGGSRGGEGRLWLSEPAMVGAGLRPGCLVSVCSSSSRFRITFCATFVLYISIL